MDDYQIIPNLLKDTNKVTLSFTSIEKTMQRGHTLPELAKTYTAWWTKQNHSFSLAWQAFGYSVKQVYLVNQKVIFIKNKE